MATDRSGAKDQRETGPLGDFENDKGSITSVHLVGLTDEGMEAITHHPFMEMALTYVLIKYVPGMRLELNMEQYNEFCSKFLHLKPHFHINDEGLGYLAEMVPVDHENHPEDKTRKEN